MNFGEMYYNLLNLLSETEIRFQSKFSVEK